ncbi:M57 family metalloprotease, partial [Sulfuricurvum sp.]|uniref:M57 family metalloprotease n=1 Tax=Sulfuricurvum sp. TaxID=2025608 RepID=UPI002E31F881
MSDYRSAPATSTVSASSNSEINTLLSGYKWGGATGTGTSLSFSFPWTTNSTALWEDNYSPSDEPNSATHFGLNSAQSDIARTALQRWANVTNLTFTEIAETGNEVGDIRFAFSSDVSDGGASGWSYYPNNYWACGGDIWISPTATNYSLNAATHLLVHELGHTLGLKHPGNYGGSEAGPFLPTGQDNQLYSVMSYNEPANNWWYDTQTSSWVYVYAEGPMIYDIATIQYMYGANMTYHATDDVYTYDDSAPFRITIWDGGGNDTISVANSTRGSLINLNEGAFSSIQTTRFYSEFGISDTYDGSYNLGIAYGAVIENATGGSGNDTLIGNGVDNILTGNAGNDILRGGAGDDILDGGAGSNFLIGGVGNDTYIFREDSDSITENASEGIDTIQSYLASTFMQANVEEVQIMSTGAADVYGNASDNQIYAGVGNNTIEGREGT